MQQSDPQGRDPHTAGAKLDASKLDLTLVPPELEEAVCRIMEFGARKYTRDGWRTVPDGPRRYFAAIERHIKAFKRGEDLDPESGLHHLAHAACNLAFELHFLAKGEDIGAWRYRGAEFTAFEEQQPVSPAVDEEDYECRRELDGNGWWYRACDNERVDDLPYTQAKIRNNRPCSCCGRDIFYVNPDDGAAAGVAAAMTPGCAVNAHTHELDGESRHEEWPRGPIDYNGPAYMRDGTIDRRRQCSCCSCVPSLELARRLHNDWGRRKDDRSRMMARACVNYRRSVSHIRPAGYAYDTVEDDPAQRQDPAHMNAYLGEAEERPRGTIDYSRSFLPRDWDRRQKCSCLSCYPDDTRPAGHMRRRRLGGRRGADRERMLRRCPHSTCMSKEE